MKNNKLARLLSSEDQIRNGIVKISQSLILNENFLEFTDMNLQEYKLFSYMVSQIKDEQEEFSPIRLTYKEMATILGVEISGGSTVAYMFDKISNIASKRLVIPNENPKKKSVTSYGIIRKFTYFSNPASCEIVLDEFLKPFLLDLKNTSCSISRMGYLSKFTSVHAIKLFFYVNALVFMKDYMTCIEKLMSVMGYYGAKDGFVSRVLKPSVQFINENTDLILTINPIKDNKAIVGFKINCKKKPSWMLDECGLKIINAKEKFSDIKEHIPENPVSNPIQLSTMPTSQQNIIKGLRKQYE